MVAVSLEYMASSTINIRRLLYYIGSCLLAECSGESRAASLAWWTPPLYSVVAILPTLSKWLRHSANTQRGCCIWLSHLKLYKICNAVCLPCCLQIAKRKNLECVNKHTWVMLEEFRRPSRVSNAIRYITWV